MGKGLDRDAIDREKNGRIVKVFDRDDSFVQQKKTLLESALVDGHYDSATSFRDFFQERFFEKRNKIVHYGEIDFQESDGKLSLTLASSLISLLNAMDKQRIAQMD